MQRKASLFDRNCLGKTHRAFYLSFANKTPGICRICVREQSSLRGESGNRLKESTAKLWPIRLMIGRSELYWVSVTHVVIAREMELYRTDTMGLIGLPQNKKHELCKFCRSERVLCKFCRSQLVKSR